MKNVRFFLVSALLAVLVTGCGAEHPAVADTDDASELTRTAFKRALERLEADGVYPDGVHNEGMGFPGMDDRTHYVDQYAILDVDSDGKEELLIQHGDDCMAGMFLDVYGYDTEKSAFCKELSQWPAVTFYDGTAKAQASHNHTSGELFPYELWIYNEEQDRYECQGGVYSMTRDIVEQMEGGTYPEEADRSKTGTVYFLYGPNETMESASPADEQDYLNWESEFFPEDTEVTPEWKNIQVPIYDSHENPA